MGLYDKYVLPKVLNCTCGSKPIQYQRKKVVPLAEGLVLDVGIGSGLNIPFYDMNKIDKVLGLDPSEALNNIAKGVAEENKVNIDFMLCGAEDIPLPDNHVDTLLITYTMCTIPEVAKANKEMHRVLKPDGKLIFCEHGLAPDPKVAKWQRRIDPFWGKIAGGCHLNRDIPNLITAAGFEITKMEEMYLPSTPSFAGYNYWGSARIK
jgi:ubiquinone/menaquinone biosynthesis C-methylase UbiE|tara:strand:- start:100 stop:720 length:621 start_codon:yes stop_codon:yes gene_type:complete